MGRPNLATMIAIAGEMADHTIEEGMAAVEAGDDEAAEALPTGPVEHGGGSGWLASDRLVPGRSGE